MTAGRKYARKRNYLSLFYYRIRMSPHNTEGQPNFFIKQSLVSTTNGLTVGGIT